MEWPNSYVIWNTNSLKVMEWNLCAYFELEPMFSRPCRHHIYGGKGHDDGPARFEPRSLAFGSYSNPLLHRCYISAGEKMWTFVILLTICRIFHLYECTASANFCQHASLDLLCATVLPQAVHYDYSVPLELNILLLIYPVCKGE